MCKKMTIAYVDNIGARRVGWCAYNEKDYSFLSDKAIKAKLIAGDLVNGLRLDEENNVVIDKEFTKILMGKSGLTFSPITEDDTDTDSVMNKYYALVKVSGDKAGKKYEFITNRCGYEIFDEHQLKAMLLVMDMGGVRLDEKGRIIIHKGVTIEGSPEGTGKATEG